MPDSREISARRGGLSLRWQLTLSYAAFVLIVGVVLIAVGVLLLRFVPEGNLVEVGGGFVPDRADLTVVFLRYAAAALVFLAAVGLSGGWLLAGRMLRALRKITEGAERVRNGDLDHRISLRGRRNELVVLADTFDAMVARIQLSTERHRRFAANASHEMRTPHAVIRTMIEVARADPARTDTSLVDDTLLERIDEMNERAIVLGEALLSLAVSENVDPASEVVDLAALVEGEVGRLVAAAQSRRIGVDRRMERALVRGDPTLLRQLVSNILENALVHNHPGGEISILTGTDAGAGAVLEVSNTGPVLSADVAATLIEPFVRGAGRARRQPGAPAGVGLGLALVASIAHAHGAQLTLAPRLGGGLTVTVRFPLVG